MLNMGDLYFVSRKNKAQFKLKERVHPYIGSTRATTKEVDKILKRMKFNRSLT